MDSSISDINGRFRLVALQSSRTRTRPPPNTQCLLGTCMRDGITRWLCVLSGVSMSLARYVSLVSWSLMYFRSSTHSPFICPPIVLMGEEWKERSDLIDCDYVCPLKQMYENCLVVKNCCAKWDWFSKVFGSPCSFREVKKFINVVKDKQRWTIIKHNFILLTSKIWFEKSFEWQSVHKKHHKIRRKYWQYLTFHKIFSFKSISTSTRAKSSLSIGEHKSVEKWCK